MSFYSFIPSLFKRSTSSPRGGAAFRQFERFREERMGEKLVKLLSKTMINEVVRRQQRPETRKRKAMWSRLLLSCLLLSALVIVIWRRKPSSVRPTYTILTMTYEKRAVLLKDFVAHYAKCPSLKSILVVWNSRTDIEATVDMAHIRATSPVPIRFRVEASPSMNNRYRPDSLLSDTDTLLILDDDLRIDCDSIKRALGAFHQSRRRDIVGWFPRFAMLGSPYSYLGEPRTIQRGEYNMILSGAAFVDHRRFELYWAPELADMRAIVDVRFHSIAQFPNFPIAQLPNRSTTHSLTLAWRRRNGTAMTCSSTSSSHQLAAGVGISGPAP